MSFRDSAQRIKQSILLATITANCKPRHSFSLYEKLIKEKVSSLPDSFLFLFLFSFQHREIFKQKTYYTAEEDHPIFLISSTTASN